MERCMVVWQLKDWSGGECSFEVIKGALLLFFPFTGYVLACEHRKRVGNISKVLDETSVEVGQFKEDLNMFDLRSSGPCGYTFDLELIHCNGVL